jgi:predicted N-acyltransferase
VFALLNRGFTVTEADLSFHLDLTRLATAEDYNAALRSPARRALRHAAGEPWSVADAGDDVRAWDEGFALLTENRASKGRELSIDRAYVERARHAFPHEIRLLTLRHASRPVAAALTYRVRPRLELVVAWGDAGHALERSPMNRLAYEVVARALREGVAVLDLGTSTLAAGGRRIPNDGLIQFKHSVGASAQVRLVLRGELSS